MKNFQKVLITGATSGIGEALARRLLEDGAGVAVCGRNERKLKELCDHYPAATGLAFDTTDYASANSIILGLLERWDGVDLAVLNAGDHQPTNAAEFSAADYARIMTINYGGALNCLEPIIKDMKQRRAGVIALMGSVAGYTGLPYAGAYCASKSALMRLAETMRAELAPYGIEVKLISPGFVKTPLTDKNEFSMPFLMDLDNAVDRIINGLSRRGFEIAFPKRLAWSLKMLSWLPHPIYFALLGRMLKK